MVVGLVLLVAFIFLVGPSLASNTIILPQPIDVGEGSGLDWDCQDTHVLLDPILDDLCDVVIIDAVADQIVQFNGTDWVNVNGTTFSDSTSCLNLGAGTILCAGGNVSIKSVVGGSGIVISNSSTTVTITNSSPESTSCGNVGSGNVVHVFGTNCNAKSLIPGDGVTISDTTDDWTFASVCENTGTGEPVCEANNNVNSLVAGEGIAIVDTTGDLTITNTLTDTNSCTNTGTGEAVCESANNINSLIAGTGITVVDTTGDLTVSTSSLVSTELCRDTASAGDTSLSCSFTAVDFIHVEAYFVTQTNTFSVGIQFNGDTSTNYAARYSVNGAGDGTGTNQASCNSNTSIGTGNRVSIIGDVFSVSSVEKSGYWTIASADASDIGAPAKTEFTCMWDNATDEITSVQITRNGGVGTLTTTALMVVSGHS